MDKMQHDPNEVKNIIDGLEGQRKKIIRNLTS